MSKKEEKAIKADKKLLQHFLSAAADGCEASKLKGILWPNFLPYPLTRKNQWSGEQNKEVWP